MLWTREHTRTTGPRSPARRVLVRSKINWNPRLPGQISGQSPHDQHRHHRRNRRLPRDELGLLEIEHPLDDVGNLADTTKRVKPT
jgi:hypothetical protein